MHYVCLQSDDQAVSIPICRACASDPDPDGRELEPPEAPCPPDGELRLEEKEDVPVEGTPLDSTGVVPCPTHGMDHLTRDPSCEFCKKALGPLYRHLKGKYGTRLDDQTPTLSFDFFGTFPSLGHWCPVYVVICVEARRHPFVVGICIGQTYKGKTYVPAFKM